MLNADGYPTEETLRTIKEWPYPDYKGLIDYIKDIWWNPVLIDSREDNNSTFFHFRTGGWSGNEDIIAAMKRNYIFWLNCWYSSTRGGFYIFEIKKEK